MQHLSQAVQTSVPSLGPTLLTHMCPQQTCDVRNNSRPSLGRACEAKELSESSIKYLYPPQACTTSNKPSSCWPGRCKYSFLWLLDLPTLFSGTLLRRQAEANINQNLGENYQFSSGWLQASSAKFRTRTLLLIGLYSIICVQICTLKKKTVIIAHRSGWNFHSRLICF